MRKEEIEFLEEIKPVCDKLGIEPKDALSAVKSLTEDMTVNAKEAEKDLNKILK